MSTRRSSPVGHRAVFELSWPIMVSMLSYTAMTIADSMFVAQLGTAPLAALGLAASGMHLLLAFPFGLLAAVRIRIAKATGAESHREARRLAWQGLVLAGVFGLVVVALFPTASQFAGLLGAEGELAGHATSYLQVRLAGAPVLLAVFAFNSWFQGRGDSRTPMVATLVANAVNIGLDPIFIFGWFGFPALGVAGASLASVVAWCAQVFVLAVAARRALWPARVGPERALLSEIWRVGLPMGTNGVLDVASFVVFASLLAHVGDAHLAAHVIVVRILMVSFLPGHAIGQAAGVLVGQRLGAGHPEGARQAWRAASIQAVALMLCMGVVFLAIPESLVSFFGAEPDVMAIATDVLVLAAFIQVFDAIAMVAFGSLNGAGDTRFTMVCGLSAVWMVKIPVSAMGVLWLDWGAFGAWMGLAAEMVVIAGFGVMRIRTGAWLVEASEPERVAAAA